MTAGFAAPARIWYTTNMDNRYRVEADQGVAKSPDDIDEAIRTNKLLCYGYESGAKVPSIFVHFTTDDIDEGKITFYQLEAMSRHPRPQTADSDLAIIETFVRLKVKTGGGYQPARMNYAYDLFKQLTVASRQLMQLDQQDPKRLVLRGLISFEIGAIERKLTSLVRNEDTQYKYGTLEQALSAIEQTDDPWELFRIFEQVGKSKLDQLYPGIQNAGRGEGLVIHLLNLITSPRNHQKIIEWWKSISSKHQVDEYLDQAVIKFFDIWQQYIQKPITS